MCGTPVALKCPVPSLFQRKKCKLLGSRKSEDRSRKEREVGGLGKKRKLEKGGRKEYNITKQFPYLHLCKTNKQHSHNESTYLHSLSSLSCISLFFDIPLLPCRNLWCPFSSPLSSFRVVNCLNAERTVGGARHII